MKIKLHEIISMSRKLIAPVNLDDAPIFEHCSGGMEAVTESYLDSDVRPLLLVHGVTVVQITRLNKA